MADDAPDYEQLLSGSDVDFRAETIYFLVVDRFHSGNPDKQREDDEMLDLTHQDWGKYWGGDLQGVYDKIPYLKEMGVSAVWTTPLFEQVQAMTVDESPRCPIHGYWTSDFKRINPRWVNHPSEKRLFQRDDTIFDKLIQELHAQGMKFVLDIVCNHSSPQTTNGKGKLYDDGKLIADFDNDTGHWYHHYGETQDWNDEWQVQNCELAGLATFNENNILFRNHVKDAVRLWLGKGVDALRVDTVKHMPLWFWQEFCSDISSAKPDVFRFGEWIHSHPGNAVAVEFANKSGMTLLDFGFCHTVRGIWSGADESGFHSLQALLDQDGVYDGATELVTFFENHDMPRLQSLGVSNEMLDLALVLLLTSRGIPCLYYGCEQYLHNDTDGGDDPYNRPMMASWDGTPARNIIKILSRERKINQAIQWGGQWPKWVDADSYAYLRRYRDYRCLVLLNKGDERELSLDHLEIPDGDYHCLLTGTRAKITNGSATFNLPRQGALVFSVLGTPVRSKVRVRFQVNGAPTQPGERLAVIGDCEALGQWDIRYGYELECINANTWFGEIAFPEDVTVVSYKYVILQPNTDDAPRRENRTVRRRQLLAGQPLKWRDHWES